MKLQWTVFVFVMALIGVFALMPASVAVAQTEHQHDLEGYCQKGAQTPGSAGILPAA